ncbi:hypothetical protein [Salinispora fenicalii]|uniref:hypothetical protein n=1 Tax=Salinispora fenicalii TaxID=1137263 RepID=UPI00047FFBD8|nr:hypothetical protein [Salinispora fenicalii]
MTRTLLVTPDQTGHAGVAVVHQSAPELRRCRTRDTRGPAISFPRGCHGTVQGCTTGNIALPAIELAAGATPTIVGGSVRPEQLVVERVRKAQSQRLRRLVGAPASTSCGP